MPTSPRVVNSAATQSETNINFVASPGWFFDTSFDRTTSKVNGSVIFGRSHLNASAIIKSFTGPTYKIAVLRFVHVCAIGSTFVVCEYIK